MKKIIYFFIVALIVVSSCSKSDNELYSTPVEIVEAKVENSSKLSNITVVKLVVYDRNNNYIELARGDWNNGNFTIEFPKTLDPNHLYALIDKSRWQPTIMNTPPTLIISKKNVKVWNAQFLGVDKDGNAVTRIFPFEIDKDGNEKSVFYTYVDSDVIISGYTKRGEGTAIDTEFHNELFRVINLLPHPIRFNKIITNYSIGWKKGWNIWTFSRFSIDGTLTEEWSATTISKLKWYSPEDFWNRNIDDGRR